jgi:hypothetical protein
MKCWICGHPANSGEHMIKASDLRDRFGAVSPDEPLYMHKLGRRNIPVRGLKSRLLMSAAPMCAECNNVRTQPYDMAWQRLSQHLGRRVTPLEVGHVIKLLQIFEGRVRASLLDVHLYFVKSFGCKAVEGSANFELQPFRDALLKRQPHPHIHVAFSPPLEDGVRRLTSTHIRALDNDFTGRTVFGVWLYALDFVAVRVAYAEPGFENRNALVGSWHPSTATSRLRVVELGRAAIE